MDISPELFLSSTNDWAVMYFEYKESSIGPHFYLLIPTVEDQFLVVCIITSKVDKQKERYAPCGEDKYVIEVGPKDISCLTRDSVIVCPQAQLMQKDVLLERISYWNQKKSLCGNIADSVKQKISFAIKQSQIVSEDVKEFV